MSRLVRSARSPKLPVLALVAGVALDVAPSQASEPPSAHEEATLESSDRYAEARRQLTSGKPDEAIELLSHALVDLPDEAGYGPMRARMILLIVEAQETAFNQDGSLERLWSAKFLLDRYLGPLELLDEQGRAEAEERRTRLIEAIARQEAARRRIQEERETAARRARAAEMRRQAKSLRLAGAMATSVGAGGLVLMLSGLWLGYAAESQTRAMTPNVPCPYPADPEGMGDATGNDCESLHGDFTAARMRGNVGNVMALTGGILGAVTLASGVPMLLVARKKGREASTLEVSPVPAAFRSGAGLTLVGRF